MPGGWSLLSRLALDVLAPILTLVLAWMSIRNNSRWFGLALVVAARGGGQLHRFKTVYFEAVRRLGLAGTGLNIHALRHTWASRMVESGADLTLLMALGGWSSLVMVQRYSHHRP